MQGMSKFQLVFLLVCGVFIVAGVAIFALGGLTSDSKNLAQATMWGTVSRDVFEQAVEMSGLNRDKLFDVTYVQKDAATFDQEFLEALASGQGPDLVFVTNKTLLRNASKLYPIPYDSYSARDFRNNFAEIGEVFFSPAGILALPLAVDPMVLYWNRDILSNVGRTAPPRVWSEFYDLSALFTKKDTNFNITQSVAPLGEFTNVSHATELMSLLLMQAGTAIVSRDSEGVIRNTLQEPAVAAERALTFYTEFANPSKSYYAWNRSLPTSKNFFLAGNLVFYPGFASEVSDLRAKNPNLNFDVAAVPQSTGAQRVTTYGDVTGIALVRNSRNVGGAFRAAVVLTSAPFAKAFSDIVGVPPVRRDLLAAKPSEAFRSLFYDAAIQARTWPMPDPTRTPAIFKEMIESVTGGRTNVTTAITQASASLNLQIPR